MDYLLRRDRGSNRTKVNRPRTDRFRSFAKITRIRFLVQVGVLGFFSWHLETAYAQTRMNSDAFSDPRGEVELTICSQNLKNYSGPAKVKIGPDGKALEDPFTDKEDALLSRFVKAKCDVIAVQEVQSKDPSFADEAIKYLADDLRKRTGRVFDTRLGESNDNSLRVGFLVATDRAEITNTITYRKVLLPKIDDNQKPHLFTRPPLELQLLVKGRGDAPSKNVGIIAFHFKSKAGAQKDPTGLEWETSRMEMAEGLIRIVEERYKDSIATGSMPLVVLGDRNANFDRASAFILMGGLHLQDFKDKAVCRLSKEGAPLCQAGAFKPQTLFSVLTSDPQTKLLPGTFVYKKVYSWLDEILLPQTSLGFARTNPDMEGDYDSGVIYDYKDASDHALVYVRLNW